MNKIEMKTKLEKLYEAQETYFKLQEEIVEEIEKLNKPIWLGPIIGDLDGYGMESVESSMEALETELERFDIKWEDEKENER